MKHRKIDGCQIFSQSGHELSGNSRNLRHQCPALKRWIELYQAYKELSTPFSGLLEEANIAEIAFFTELNSVSKHIENGTCECTLQLETSCDYAKNRSENCIELETKVQSNW